MTINYFSPSARRLNRRISTIFFQIVRPLRILLLRSLIAEVAEAWQQYETRECTCNQVMTRGLAALTLLLEYGRLLSRLGFI